MNLGNVVRFWSYWNPDGVSVVVGDTSVTWAELHERTSRLATGFAELGVRRGDRVGILANNCLEYLEIVIAGYKLGSILVPLNVRLTAGELRYIIEHAGCRAVVADAELGALAAAALDGSERDVLRIGLSDAADNGFGVPLAELRRSEAVDPDADVATDDVAYICYTSGTTGTPKGAMLSHGNVLALGHHRILTDDLVSTSRVYLPFPLSFTGGLCLDVGADVRERRHARARHRRRPRTGDGRHRAPPHHQLQRGARDLADDPAAPDVRPVRPLVARHLRLGWRVGARVAADRPAGRRPADEPGLRADRGHRHEHLAAGRRRHPQARLVRQADDAHPGPHRRSRGSRAGRRGCRRGGRADHQGPGRHARLLAEPGGHRGGARRRLAAHGRPGPDRRRGLRLHRRPARRTC